MDKYRKIILGLFFLSGICGLIYEVIWVRMLGLVFGNTIYAVSTVLAAFMAGLALGSWYFGKYIDRSTSPLKVYGMLEAGIGIYCILTPILFMIIQKIYISLGATQVTAGPILLIFLLGFITILIPTALMGGTLPVLSKYFVGQTEDIGSNVGILYSVNTWGAVLGAFATGYILIMLLGVEGTLYVAAATNLAIAGVVFLLAKGVAPLAMRQRETSVVTPKISPPSLLATRYSLLVLIAIGLSGFTALTYEVVWTRVLSMVLGSSVYAFATMLCAFLAGIALGSMIYAKFSGGVGLYARNNTPTKDYTTFGFLEGAIGVSVLLLIPVFGILPFTFLKIFKTVGQNFVGFQFFQFLLAFGVMLVPTTLFGATVPLACKIYSGSRQNMVGSSVGNVYAANTIGAILGSILAGFAFVHLIGLQKTITIVAMINVGLAIILINFAPFGSRTLKGAKTQAKACGYLMERRWVRGLVTCFVIFFTIPYVLSLPQWNKKIITSGIYQYAPDFEKDTEQIAGADLEKWKKWVDEEILYYKEGRLFTVAVKKSSRGKLSLSIDGKTDASNDIRGDMITQVLSGHLPLLIYSAKTAEESQRPQKVLVVGLASGVTLGAVTRWENVKEIDCVEIEPVMIEASKFFAHENHNILTDPRVNLIINDVRNYLLTTDKKFDIIISEPSNPWMSGQSNLFTKDYFQLAKNRLNDKGVFVQWLHYYNMSTRDYKMVLKTFQSIFPHSSLWLARHGDTLLLATPERLSIDYEKLKQILADSKINADLKQINLNEPILLLTKFVMGEETIKSFTTSIPLHTDNHPRLEFSAPKSLYKMETGPKNYRILYKNMETVSPYLKNFKENIELAKTYIDNSLYLPGEKEISLIESSAPSPLYYRLLSQICLAKKDFGKALTHIQDALKINPEYAEGFDQFGRIYLAQKKYNKALKEFQKAQKLDPSFLKPYINQAIVYLDYMNVPPAAMFILKDAVNVNPKSSEVYYHLGRALFKLKDYKQSADMFSKAIFYNPDYEDIVRETLIKLQKKG